jgi:hypothetical protein
MMAWIRLARFVVLTLLFLLTAAVVWATATDR